jgi:exonuclease III
MAQNNNTRNSLTLNLISFNANGLRDGRKRRSFFAWLKKFHNAKSKITLLQETHTDVNNEGAWKDDWGNKNILFAHGDSSSRGVAIILPSDVEYTIHDEIRDPNGRFLAINISIGGNTVWIINGYAPTANNPTGQMEWLTKIQTILNPLGDANIIIGGDLNDYFNPKLDKYKPKDNLQETDYIKAWKATCEDQSLCEIWRTLNPDTKRYTWRRGGSLSKLQQSRLDYWLISTHMIYDLKSVDIKTGFRSDHSLIDINFQGHETKDRGPSYWRFNASLLKDNKYTEYMNTRIEEIKQLHDNIDNDALKWDVIKMELRASTICYSKTKAKENRDNFRETVLKNDKLEKELSTNPSEEILNEYNSTKLEIEYYNNEKAQGAVIRSKADWAEFGEKNTKFFLNLEKRNYKNKCITTLLNDNDELIEDSDEILTYEAKFYNKLYSLPPEIDETEKVEIKNKFLNANTPQINEAEVELCEQDITLKEIGTALKELKNRKSPGTDGFTPDFYKFFWPKLQD